MAGKSVFFDEDAYHYPKPLVEINGKPMIQHVIENLSTIDVIDKFIFVVNREACRKYHLDNVLNLLTHGQCEIITIARETKGFACSALLAIEHINNDDELIISNSDQVFWEDLNTMLDSFRKKELDAGVPVFEAVHPRWSYVRLDTEQHIMETAEKKPLSRHAIAGLFYFRQGRLFVNAAMKMIRKDASVNGAYYIAPALNELILEKRNLGIHTVDGEKYHSFYTPEKIKIYENRKKPQ